MTDPHSDPLFDALREQLADYGQEPPAHLWTGIRQQLPPPVALPQRRRRRRALLLVASLLLVLAGLSWQLGLLRPGTGGQRPLATTSQPAASNKHAAALPARAPIAASQHSTATTPTTPPAAGASTAVRPTPTSAAAALATAGTSPSHSAAVSLPGRNEASAAPATTGSSPATATAATTATTATTSATATAAKSNLAAGLATAGRVASAKAARSHTAARPGTSQPSAPASRSALPAAALATATHARSVAARQARPLAQQAPGTASRQSATHALALNPVAAVAAQGHQTTTAGSSGLENLTENQKIQSITTASNSPTAATSGTSLAVDNARLALRPVALPPLQVPAPATPEQQPQHKLPVPPVPRWAVQLLAGPAFTSSRQGYVEPLAGNVPVNVYRTSTEQEQPALGSSLQLSVRRRLGQHWQLSSGLSFSDYATRTNLMVKQYSSTSMASDLLDTSYVLSTYRKSQQVLALPLRLGYQAHPSGRWQLGLQAGLDVNLVLATTDLAANRGYGLNPWGLGGSVALDASYHLAGRWAITLQPTASYRFTALYKNRSGEAPRHPWGTALLLGASYDIP